MRHNRGRRGGYGRPPLDSFDAGGGYRPARFNPAQMQQNIRFPQMQQNPHFSQMHQFPSRFPVVPQHMQGNSNISNFNRNFDGNIPPWAAQIENIPNLQGNWDPGRECNLQKQARLNQEHPDSTGIFGNISSNHTNISSLPSNSQGNSIETPRTDVDKTDSDDSSSSSSSDSDSDSSTSSPSSSPAKQTPNEIPLELSHTATLQPPQVQLPLNINLPSSLPNYLPSMNLGQYPNQRPMIPNIRPFLPRPPLPPQSLMMPIIHQHKPLVPPLPNMPTVADVPLPTMPAISESTTKNSILVSANTATTVEDDNSLETCLASESMFEESKLPLPPGVTALHELDSITPPPPPPLLSGGTSVVTHEGISDTEAVKLSENDLTPDPELLNATNSQTFSPSIQRDDKQKTTVRYVEECYIDISKSLFLGNIKCKQRFRALYVDS